MPHPLLLSSRTSSAILAPACGRGRPRSTLTDPVLWLRDTHQFYSIFDDRFYTLPPFPHDLLSTHGCDGVHDDWLILYPTRFRRGVEVGETSQYYSYFYSLYNPFSTTRISLPAVPSDRGESDLVLPSSPLDPDSMAALLLGLRPLQKTHRGL